MDNFNVFENYFTECSENFMISVSLGMSHKATDLSSEKLTT